MYETIQKCLLFIWDNILSPQVIFISTALVLVMIFSRKNNNFFDVKNIFADHFKIFKGAKGQIFIYYFLPFILALGTVKIKTVAHGIIDNIIIVLSIFLSFLFAMLSIVGGYTSVSDDSKKLLNQTHNSILYESILCIISLLIALGVLFVGEISNQIILYIISYILYGIMYMIVLNVFIVLKRVKILFETRNI